jgi:hypothetical protein
MGTIHDPPSVMAIMAAALEAAPEIRKQWTENAGRSDMIKSAFDAMQSGQIEEAADILGSVVEKAGAADPKPEPKLPTLVISQVDPDQRGEVSAARLMAKRDALVAMRDRLRNLRGQDLAKAAPTAIKAAGGIAVATRLTKAEIARRDMLQHRVKLLRDQLNNAARNWQPLPEVIGHERIQ